MAKIMILTNNPLVKEKYEEKFEIQFCDVGYTEILTLARDHVHKGHQLFSHPLSGSIKPKETPYKSMLISRNTSPGFDYRSLVLIENSLILANNFVNKFTEITPEMDMDFRELDYTLISSALQTMPMQNTV